MLFDIISISLNQDHMFFYWQGYQILDKDFDKHFKTTYLLFNRIIYKTITCFITYFDKRNLFTALDQELEALPKWLWQQTPLSELSIQEQKLWKIVCFSWTRFVDNCTETTLGQTSAALTRLGNDYERTWWVRRVVPVFQTFANQTGLLSFDWCECEVKHHALADMKPEDYQTGSPWFPDGLGYDWTGLERLVMEGFLGTTQRKNTKDD